MPTGGDVAERAWWRVRVSAPAGDSAVFLANCAAVPFAGADGGVAAFGGFEQVCWSAAPAVDSAGAVEGAGVVAAGVKGDVAVGGGVRSEGVGDAESQECEQQRGKRPEERFTPPPPDRVSAAAARRAWWGVVGRLAVWFTVFTLHQWRV